MSEPVGSLQLLRQNVAFRRLWLAEVVSFLGDWFNTIALYAAVEELSGSTEAVATVFVAKLLPVFLMTPVAGPLIDRFDRRKLMIATDLLRAACAVGLALAYRQRSLTLLLALLVVKVAFAGVFIPTKTAVVPQVAAPRELGVANALSAATWSTMLALGAALGGLVTALVGIEMSLIIDGATFVVSAALLWPLPPLLPDADSPGGEGDEDDGVEVERGFIAGVRYLLRTPRLAAVLALKPGMALAAGALVMIPVFGSRVFEEAQGPAGMGILYTARGLGALVGSLAVGRFLGDSPKALRRAVLPAYLVIALSYVGLSQSGHIAWAAIAYFGSAVGGATIWVASGTLGHLLSNNAYRGRVFAIEWGALTLAMSGVAWVAGAAVERWGVSVWRVAFVSGVALALPALAWSVNLAWGRRAATRSA